MMARTKNIVVHLMCMTLAQTVAFSSYNHILEQSFAMEPQDQVAVVGARVILPCRVINKHGVLQWTKDDFGLGTRRNLSGFDRYTMVGSDEEGDFSLQIYPVTLDDNGKFQCQVSPGGYGHPGIRSKYAALTVLVSPDPPKILQGDYILTTEDREIELECVSENGKPAAEITWIDGLENVLTTGVEYEAQPTPDNRRFTAKSILKLKANKEFHNKTIICQAQNSVDKTYRLASIRLEVNYAPKVVVVVEEGALDTGRIPEGNTVKFWCNADANPNDMSYRWFMNDEVIANATLNQLEMFNVTRKYQSSIVKCEAQNEVGISSDSESLDIIYPPSFVRRPHNIQADSQENITLVCIVDANPTPDIIWVFDPIDRVNFAPSVVGVSPMLSIVASNETAGRYYCKAQSIGFPEISAEALVILKGPPKILSPTEQFPSNSEAYEIECVAYSVPKAKHVSWAFNGVLIDLDKDLGFSLREEYLPEGIKSTLRIEEHHEQHFGTYSCFVINKYGSDTLDIVFTAQREIPLVLVASGGCFVLLIFIVSCVGICCCMRPKKRILPPADIIPKVNQNKTTNSPRKKLEIIKDEMPTVLAVEQEYQESNSGSYSTTTTLSMNKTEMMIGRLLTLPPNLRYSDNFHDGLSSTNHSINGSYVDYARDYYTPSIQNANNCLIQNIQRGETPTYV